eukprot:scaffold733_cov267-Pinguiococcus_pyrenoidosus.AAC.18
MALLPDGVVVASQSQAGLATKLLVPGHLVAEADDVDAHLADARSEGLLRHGSIRERQGEADSLVRAAQDPLQLTELGFLGAHHLRRHHRRELELADEGLEGLRAEDHGEEGLAVHHVRLVQVFLPFRVVLCAAPGVGEHLVGFADLLEFLIRVWVIQVLVRVKLQGELAVRLLDLGLGGIRLHPQRVVVLPLLDILLLVLRLVIEAQLRTIDGPLRRERLVHIDGFDLPGLFRQAVRDVGAGPLIPLLVSRLRADRSWRVDGSLDHLLHRHSGLEKRKADRA